MEKRNKLFHDVYFPRYADPQNYLKSTNWGELASRTIATNFCMNQSWFIQNLGSITTDSGSSTNEPLERKFEIN